MEINACGMVVRVKEGETVNVGGVVVEDVPELGLGLFSTELDAEFVEAVLELGLGGFPTELDAEPTPGGGCPTNGGVKYAARTSKPGILGV